MKRPYSVSEKLMPAIDIYTRPGCGYCHRALSLLQKKGVVFNEIEAGSDPAKRQEMIQRAGGRATYPQIFIGDQHIGGCDEMMTLEFNGKLDPLLKAE